MGIMICLGKYAIRGTEIVKSGSLFSDAVFSRLFQAKLNASRLLERLVRDALDVGSGHAHS